MNNSKPIFELKPHPWPGAPKGIQDLDKHLGLAEEAAKLERASVTSHLLKQVRDAFWEAVLDAVTSPDPTANPSGDEAYGKGIWEGRTRNETRGLRHQAVLDVLAAGHLRGHNDGWMATAEVIKAKGLPNNHKAVYILSQLHQAGLVERRHARKGRGRDRFDWRHIPTAN